MNDFPQSCTQPHYLKLAEVLTKVALNHITLNCLRFSPKLHSTTLP